MRKIKHNTTGIPTWGTDYNPATRALELLGPRYENELAKLDKDYDDRKQALRGHNSLPKNQNQYHHNNDNK